jgi:hypothetical protein
MTMRMPLAVIGGALAVTLAQLGGLPDAGVGIAPSAPITPGGSDAGLASPSLTPPSLVQPLDGGATNDVTPDDGGPGQLGPPAPPAPDRAGVMRADRDAGSPDAGSRMAEVRDAGPADGGSRAEARAAAVEVELRSLRTRVLELQDELQRARDEAGQLDETNDHLSAMRQQLADTDERQRQRDERSDAQHAAAQQAVLQIGVVQESLAYGDSNVDSSLSHIEVGLTGVARSDVSAARAALDRGDSFAARIWLSQAAVDAQRSRY